MAGLTFQEHVAHQTVPVGVQGAGILPIGIHQDRSLKHGRFLGVRAHVIKLLPPVHVLLHRFPVKKHHRSPRIHGFVNDDGGRGTVHAVDAQGVTSKGYQALHLAVLGVLAPLGVQDIQLYLDSCFLFIFLCLILQACAQGADEGIIPAVEKDPDTDGILLCLPLSFMFPVLPEPDQDAGP